MKKLFLLDAFALIYRAHFAFIKNPRINSKGLNTSAIFGFVNAMNEVIRKENPTHLAVVFDVAGRGKREEIFADYKANRDETPDDIRTAIPYIYKILEAMNIPALGSEGYEADDVIGTLAKKAEKAGFQTYMMTPDKDYAQLVSENIFMYKPSRGGEGPQTWGVKEVQEKLLDYGIQLTIRNLLYNSANKIENIDAEIKVEGKSKATASWTKARDGFKFMILSKKSIA